MKYSIILCALIILSLTSSQINKNEGNKQGEKPQSDKEIIFNKPEVVYRKEITLNDQQQNNNINDLPKLYQKVKSSVYLIYTKNANGISQGSAFVISSDGVAISNFHVFEAASDEIAINENGEKFQISQILDYSKELDYIIFRLNTTRPIPFIEISNVLPEIGEDCFAVGNPEGLTQTLSKGIVSSYRENKNYIQTTTDITHGSSGGPLFNNFGKVIGITTMGFDAGGLNFALSILKVPYSANLKKAIVNSSQSYIDQGRIKKLIQQYYSIAEQRDYNQLNTVFTSRMTRYFNNFDIDINQVIKLSENYNKKYGVISSSSSVRWDSFKISKLIYGNYSIDYILDYSISRTDKNKPSKFVLHIIAEVTSDYHIQGIYENIIDKY
jgi:hypothetical protein